MSSLNLHEIKAELKVHGCKLKTQLDGTWAIHEPRGKRVIVPNLEAVEEYCRARSGGSAATVHAQGQIHAQGHMHPQGHTHEHVRSYAPVDVTPVEPVIMAQPDPVIDVQPALPEIPQPSPEPVRVAAVAEPVKPFVAESSFVKLDNTPKPLPASALPLVETNVEPVPVAVMPVSADTSFGQEDNSALRLSNLRVELKKMGCKLKSQLDGTWCIDESKGRRTIVPNLNAVQAYIDAKNGKPATPQAQQPGRPVVAVEPEVKATRPLTAAVLAEMTTPVVDTAVEPAPVAPVKAAVSPEQMEALAIVNQMLRDIKATRLPQGLNFLHSEILPYLQDNNCPAAYIEKAVSYAEAKLQKDCIDKVLVKRVFKNHRDHQDIMYFEARYASVLSPS